MFDRLCYLTPIKEEKAVFFKDKTKAFELSNMKAWSTIKWICLSVTLAVLQLIESRYNIDNILVSIILGLPLNYVFLNIGINIALMFSKKSLAQLTDNSKPKQNNKE